MIECVIIKKFLLGSNLSVFHLEVLLLEFDLEVLLLEFGQFLFFQFNCYTRIFTYFFIIKINVQCAFSANFTLHSTLEYILLFTALDQQCIK